MESQYSGLGLVFRKQSIQKNNVVKPTDLASITLDNAAGRHSTWVSLFRDSFVGNDALYPRFDQMSRSDFKTLGKRTPLPTSD
jgi:hypothetical protein